MAGIGAEGVPYYDDTGPEGNRSPPPEESNEGVVAAMTAQLLREQFEHWKSVFLPLELGQMNELSFNNPDVLPLAVNKAGGTADEMNRISRGVLQRSNAALGIEATAGQDQTSRRLMDLSRARAISGAENTARANVRRQDEMVLMGTAPNPNIVKGNQ